MRVETFEIERKEEGLRFVAEICLFLSKRLDIDSITVLTFLPVQGKPKQFTTE